jgi:hypothetical protein
MFGVMLVAMSLTACAPAPPGGAEPTPTLRPAGSPGISPQPGSSTASPRSGENVILTYVAVDPGAERESLTVRTDGTTISTTALGRREVRLGASDIARIREEFTAAGFAGLSPQYGDIAPGRAMFSITYVTPGRVVAVTVGDFTAAPASLVALGTSLDSLMHRVTQS